MKKPSLSPTIKGAVVSSPWIIGPWADWLLVIGAPLIILPGVLSAQARWSEEQIILFIAAFGQLGHNLPGMIRAYGDRALFRQYRVRFIVAPVLLIGLCAAGAIWRLQGLVLISATWGIWHALMQTYGFLRIYDAKSARFSDLDRRLDFYLCLAWFGGAVLFSDYRMALLIDYFHLSGVPAVPGSLLTGLRSLWLAGLLVTTAVYLLHLVNSHRRGNAPNMVKLALLLVSIGFYWYTSLGVRNVLVGLAMFEVFHDVQYLAIVWLFNRNRAEKDPGAGAFLRFLFRRSGALVGVYVGLIFAYGGLRYFEHGLSDTAFRDVFTGILAASGLLHFYYDGFIWKVRDRATRNSLGIDSKQDQPRSVLNTGSVVHCLKWSLLVVPLTVLAYLQWRAAPSPLGRAQSMTVSLPNYSQGHHDLAVLLHEQGKLAQACAAYETAIARDGKFTDARVNYGAALRSLGRLEESARQFRAVLKYNARNAAAHSGLAQTLAALGAPLPAEKHYELAVQFRPDDAEAHNNYGILLARSRRFAQAQMHFRRTIELIPDHAAAHFNLGNVLSRQGHIADAEKSYQRALRIKPNYDKAAQRLHQLQRTSKHAES